MYTHTIDQFARVAATKVELLERNPLGFFIGAMKAGAYVGLGIALIFILGSDVDPAYRKLVMGTAFGIALSLVVFAGSELFTGHTMYMTLGCLQKTTSLLDLSRVWLLVWIGNLAGAALLAAIFLLGGAGGLVSDSSSFLNQVASVKMNTPAIELLARGILCNWLVCLALWMSGRTDNDAAKCILIFWCLFAFIASGFEHSVANMTLFSIALLGEHPSEVSLSGMAYNLFWVTFGNLLSGSLFVACGYWAYSGANTGDDDLAVMTAAGETAP
ncbi:MAG: formate/nitrite transporter family protein [Deltaproteobacteria bacterium]|nr:formate/nitrite transporter family protein [Deltaproteobacteria bacterium]MBW2421029.1 formate/nitrite transporter family protein [Deltaproteobacteria bacterium]